MSKTRSNVPPHGRADRQGVSSDLALKLSVRPGRRSAPQVVKTWIVPMLVVIVVAFLVSTAFYAVDLFYFDGLLLGAPGLLEHYLEFRPSLITDALPALGVTVVATLGIILTVIAIIVQLSAERYTGVAMMFLRDPVHVLVLSFYIVASLCAVWLSVTLRADFVPRSLLLFVMSLTSIGLATMLPYFAYTFWFLEPGNILERLRARASRLSQRGFAAESAAEVAAAQVEFLRQVEEITDIANNSVEGRDRIIAVNAVDALRDFLITYAAERPDGPNPWYRIGEPLNFTPGFVGTERQLLAEVEARALWVEWTILREYLGIYREAMGSMPEVNGAIAINTRYVGEIAAQSGREDLVRMVMRFLNVYLQLAIHDGHPAVACDVSRQYRMLLEELLQLGNDSAACEGVSFLQDYGHIAFDAELPAVTETVAFDVARLCEHAHANGLTGENRILRQLLDLDEGDTVRSKRQERTLRGVRCAQTKLALYYLAAGEVAKARLIAEDMQDMENKELADLRADMTQTPPPHFWEALDQGRTLHYLTEAERSQFDAFFTLQRSATGA